MSNFTTAALATMSKDALRKEMRARNMQYAGMNNDAMRNALGTFATDVAVDEQAELAEPQFADETTVQTVGTEMGDTAGELAIDAGDHMEAPEVLADVAAEQVLDSTLAQGLEDATQEVAPTDVVPTELRDAPEPVATPVVVTEKSARKVQKERAEANGVKRPSEGTICAQIWAWCDEQNAGGVRPEAKALRAALPDLDDTTKTVQFYRWRKFNGIQGR